MNEEDKQKDIKELIEARMRTIPRDAILSVGSHGEYTRDELLQEIENNSEIGKKMIEIQIKYLQKLKEGILYGKNTNY